jgi:L-aminopeptidase/D-esterase-like protein
MGGPPCFGHRPLPADRHGAVTPNITQQRSSVPSGSGALFRATVQATEEAIVNALPAAETMTGADGYTVFALPAARLQSVLMEVLP